MNLKSIKKHILQSVSVWSKNFLLSIINFEQNHATGRKSIILTGAFTGLIT